MFNQLLMGLLDSAAGRWAGTRCLLVWCACSSISFSVLPAGRHPACRLHLPRCCSLLLPLPATCSPGACLPACSDACEALAALSISQGQDELSASAQPAAGSAAGTQMAVDTAQVGLAGCCVLRAVAACRAA